MHLHGVILNYLSTGTALLLQALNRMIGDNLNNIRHKASGTKLLELNTDKLV
jgi:hypothetical protein